MTIELHPDVQNFMVKGLGPLSDEAFERFCQANQELRIERDPKGNLIIMPPIHTESGSHEAEVFGELFNWNRKAGSGRVFSPSTGFMLPDTSIRSADASWISAKRYNALNINERKKFATIVPEFVVEVMSDSDSLRKAKEKMTTVWIENGVLLAWLIDVNDQKAYIYRKNGSVDIVEGFDHSLSGEEVLPGFEFDLRLLKNT